MIVVGRVVGCEDTRNSFCGFNNWGVKCYIEQGREKSWKNLACVCIEGSLLVETRNWILQSLGFAMTH